MCLVLTFWLLGNYVAAVHLSHASQNIAKPAEHRQTRRVRLSARGVLAGISGRRGVPHRVNVGQKETACPGAEPTHRFLVRGNLGSGPGVSRGA